jgi:hypothetical protein
MVPVLMSAMEFAFIALKMTGVIFTLANVLANSYGHLILGCCIDWYVMGISLCGQGVFLSISQHLGLLLEQLGQQF